MAAVVVSTALCLVVRMPAAAAVERAVVEPASGAPATVAVDASEVGTMPARMVADVAAKATQALEDAGVPPGSVRLSFVEIDPMTVLRGVRVALVTDVLTLTDPDGDPRGPVLASCTACSDAELAGVAIEAVLEAIERHEDAQQAQRGEPAPEPAPVTALPPEPAPPPPSDVPRRRLGPLGVSGVVALSLGAGSIVGGAVLAVREPAPFPNEPRMDVLRDLRPAGYAMLAVGGALVIAGAVLVTVDRHRARAARRLGRFRGPAITLGLAGPK